MTGCGRLIRLILRRDRVVLPLWVVLLALVPAGYAASFESLFPTDAERIHYAQASADNAGFVALYGLLRGDSLGELAAWRAGFLPVIIGLCAILTVIRHTRADEEAGRSELIGAAVVGRHAKLAAALLTTAGAALVLGLILFAAMSARGMPAGGALAFGAAFALTGWAFAAIAGITAQLTSSARGARGLAIVVLGVSYVLRLAGDISALGDGAFSWLSWLSPLGWATHVFPFGADNWWPVLLAAVFSVAAAAAAMVLLARRDVGDGLLPARVGRPTAPPALRTPLALAWRLHRGLLIGWTIGFALLGLVFGGVGGSVLDIAGDDQQLSDLFNRFGGSTVLLDSYFAGTARLVGLIAACYAVQATLRLRDEEQSGHAESVLATSVSRWSWSLSHLLFSLLGPVVILFAEGLVTGLTYPDGDLAQIIEGTMVQLPAVWVVAASAVLVFGLLPRLSPAAWAVPALCLLVLLVGQTLQLDQWLLNVSPFTHVPSLPGGELAATPLLWLTAIAAVLAGTGLTALRRRNVPD